MSALRAIAWGMIDPTQCKTHEEFNAIVKLAVAEILAADMMLSPGRTIRKRSTSYWRLLGPPELDGRGYKRVRKVLAHGPLRHCCKTAIEPHNHGTTPCS